MAKKSNGAFWEKYKHPLWQKKRLEILNRENWCCENCGNDEETLHIHHSYYERDVDPWDYPNESLHCLCEGCHEYEQENVIDMKRAIGTLPLTDTILITDFINLRHAIEHGDANVKLSMISPWELSACEYITGLDRSDIIWMTREHKVKVYDLRMGMRFRATQLTVRQMIEKRDADPFAEINLCAATG